MTCYVPSHPYTSVAVSSRLMERKKLSIHQLKSNTGQIPGVPKNPRVIKDARFWALVDSLNTLPEMLEARDIIVYPYDGHYVILGGTQRVKACKELGWKSVPCCILPEDTPTEKLRRIILADNYNAGENDLDALAEGWELDELADYEIEVPDMTDADDGGDASSDEAGAEEAQEEMQQEEGKQDFFQMMLGDRLYDSDNVFDIPTLRIDCQPENGVLLPVSAWGADSRQKKGIQTYHFYVDDYRFEAIWKDPMKVLLSDCSCVVEPNLSLFDTTPVAYGLQQIYKKRWISRYWQECGVKVYADLNVSLKFREYNRMGIPDGYNAFATRGYDDRIETLETELQLAREISGKVTPNLIVYGGGKRVKALCQENNILYVEQFISRVRNG